MTLDGNRTLAILRKAEQEGYGILAQTWYDSGSYPRMYATADM